jgi:hypothetical protein
MMQAATQRCQSDPAEDDRLLIVSSCAALATLLPVVLYQTGVVSDLPDPPLRIFNSPRITQSSAAHPFGIPDSLLGVASFGITLTLALVARRHDGVKTALGAKLALDASAAAFNAGRQVVCFGQLCSWCTLTAMATAVMAYAGRYVILRTWTRSKAAAKAFGGH